MSANNTRFEEWEARKLQEPRFRAAVEELEPAYQVTRLRIARGLTQAELAKLAGTRQPSIARLESGRGGLNLGFLRRVVQAMGGRLEIRIVLPDEETVGDAQTTHVFADVQSSPREETAQGFLEQPLLGPSQEPSLHVTWWSSAANVPKPIEATV